MGLDLQPDGLTAGLVDAKSLGAQRYTHDIIHVHIEQYI